MLSRALISTRQRTGGGEMEAERLQLSSTAVTTIRFRFVKIDNTRTRTSRGGFSR